MADSKIIAFAKTHKDTIKEWYRLYFHTISVTILIIFNMTFLLYNSLMSFLSVIAGTKLGIPYIDFQEISWVTLFILLNIPLLTWFYSTITQSIKKGYKNIIDWSKTKKGRVLAGIFNAIPFITMSWFVLSRYASEKYKPYLSTIFVDNEYLAVNDMSAFIIFLYLVPALFTPIIIGGIIGEFMKKKSLPKQFYKWEFPLLAGQSFNLKEQSCDVIIGWDKKTKKPIVLKEKERFLHELVVGATGSGKTSTSILPRIALDLVRIARGYKCSIILIEPKGDAVEDVLKIAKDLNIPDNLIKVIDPTKKNKHSIKFNPFAGDMAAAAEGFRGTLNSLTGDQDAFFAGQQEETAALFTMLAKIRFGNLANISIIQRMYTEPRYLANVAEQVREEVDKLKNKEDLTPEEKVLSKQYDRVVSYFENEVLDYKTFTNKQGDREPRYYQQGPYKGMQEVENKKDKFVTGAKKYLNDISMNAMLTDLMIAEGDEEVLNLDSFLDEGGILLINTGLGELEELSILLGQFIIRQIQSAVFRRPREEDGYKRIPTFLSIDEFPLYANENFERLLTLGRSYKVGTLIALQSLGQLERIVPGYKETIMTNASTKTVFGRGVYEDNEAFSNQFGEEERVEESLNESTTPMTVDNPSWGYRHNTQRMLMPRFTPSEIQELEFKHCIVQPVNEDGTIGDARMAIGKFVNETGILKKYVNVNKIELSTKTHKDVDVSVAERLSESDSIVKEIETTNKETDNENGINITLPENTEEGFSETDILGLDEDIQLNEKEISEEILEDTSDEPILNNNEDIELDVSYEQEPEVLTEESTREENIVSIEEPDTVEITLSSDDVESVEQTNTTNPNNYENSIPTADMEDAISLLLDKTNENIEQPTEDDDKYEKKYNMIHEAKKPSEVEIVEDDDF